MRVQRHQNRLPRECEDAAPPEMFKTRLDLGFGLVESVLSLWQGVGKGDF